MPDITTTQEDTVPSEEGSNQDYTEFPNAAGKSENGKRLGVEQDVQADQLADADADSMMVAALNNYGSLEEANNAIHRLKPELALLIAQAAFLIALQSKAKDISADLVPKEGKPDGYYAHDRFSRYKDIRQSAATADRVLEDFCSARGVDYSKMDIKLIQDDPAIKNLDTTRPKPFRPRQEATPEQGHLDLDT